MKILISGWPGAGATTLALILSKTLKLKYIGGTEIFRKLGENLGFSNTGIDRVNADKYLEDHFGAIYDKFIGKILLEPEFDNVLVESDIAGFLYKKNHPFFSIFLTTQYSERLKRLGVDGRNADIEFLKHREEENAKFYKTLHGIDWFDLNQINLSYDLVIDNTQKSITKELEDIFSSLHTNKLITKDMLNSSMQNAKNEDQEFWENGKDSIKNFLKGNNLFMSEKEIADLIENFFKPDLEKLPADIQKAFEKIKA